MGLCFLLHRFHQSANYEPVENSSGSFMDLHLFAIKLLILCYLRKANHQSLALGHDYLLAFNTHATA
jgi:hypothetical protein